MAISGYEGSIYILDSSAAPTPITDEAMSAVDATRTLYKVSDRAKRWWDPTKSITVAVNSVMVWPSDYESICAGGMIRFHEARAAGATVEVDMSYWPTTKVSKLGKCREWTLDAKIGMKDVTNWDSDPGFEEWVPLLTGATASLSRWWVDPLYLDSLTATNSPLLGFELRVSPSLRYYVYGRLTSNSIKSAVSDIADESLEIQISHGIGYAVEV